MGKRIIVRMVSGLSFAGYKEENNIITSDFDGKYICICPRENCELKMILPVNEIETVFIDGNKLEGESILNI